MEKRTRALRMLRSLRLSRSDTKCLLTRSYTAAKFGVVGLTKSVALELAERGIRVNAICPGGTATWIWAPAFPEMPADLVEQIPEIVKPWVGADKPLGRAGLPTDIANAALWLASSESSWATGQALVVDDGLTAGRAWSQSLNRIDELREHIRSAASRWSNRLLIGTRVPEKTGLKRSRLFKNWNLVNNGSWIV